MLCPNCGSPVNPSQKFCTKCGTNFHQNMNVQRLSAPKYAKQGSGSVPKLYKYLHWEYAIDLLERSSLYFSNPRDWNDRYEKKVLEGRYTIDKTITYPLKDKVFATCFTSEYSCEAQWKMYLHENTKKNNIAIEIEFDRENCLQN